MVPGPFLFSFLYALIVYYDIVADFLADTDLKGRHQCTDSTLQLLSETQHIDLHHFHRVKQFIHLFFRKGAFAQQHLSDRFTGGNRRFGNVC